jgi:hypothetical protein
MVCFFDALRDTVKKDENSPERASRRAYQVQTPSLTPSKNRHLPGNDALWHPQNIFHLLAGEAGSLREIANHFKQLIYTKTKKRIL